MENTKFLLLGLCAFTLTLTACEKANTSGCGSTTQVTDIDGNVYQTITIGTQCWMTTNLKVTKYRNGDAIPNVTDGVAWSGLSSGAYSNYNNDPSVGNVAFGRLYNWHAVNDSRKIAPSGWHVPTDTEFETLSTYLGGGSVSGAKLKDVTPVWDGNNSSGFTGLPGGYRNDINGTFGDLGGWGFFWTSTMSTATSAYAPYMMTGSSQLYSFNPQNNEYGYSVRCIMD